MMLYAIDGGGFLGFYGEYGGSVSVSGTRTIQVSEWVVKERPVEVKKPARYEDVEVWYPEISEIELVLVAEYSEEQTRTVEAGWLYRQVWIEGHFEPRRYWIEEDCEYKLVTELRNILGVMVPVTRPILVCEPAHWGERQEWISGWWKEVSTWVEEHEESFMVVIPEHFEEQLVTYPGYYKTETVYRPAETVIEMVESGQFEMVDYEENIYSYDGSSDEYCLTELKRGVGELREGAEPTDNLQLRYTGTNTWFSLDAWFVSCCTAIGSNKYVA